MRAPLRAAFRRLAVDRRGNLATMTALTAPVALALAAIAVDSGALYLQKRDTQLLADLAAITAAAHIGNAEAAAMATLEDNGIRNIVLIRTGSAPDIDTSAAADATFLSVIRGRYAPSPSVSVADRFKAGEQPFNAVRVSLRKKGSMHFGARIMAPPTIGTTAIASARAEAAFSVGSRLASLNGGVLNALLSGLTGSSISLSVMDYDALLDGNVQLFGLLDAFATELNITAGTYADVMNAEAKVGKLAAAMARIDGVGNAAKIALNKLARDASGTPAAKVRLSRVLDIGSAANLPIGNPPAGFGAMVGLLDLLAGSAVMANGQHQLALDLGASVPGLLAAKLDLAVGEPPQFAPWFKVGETGAVVRTAQTRLLLTATVGGPGGVAGTSLKLPIYGEVAFAEAKLTGVSCPTGRPDSMEVAIAARPGVAELRIAETSAATLSDFRNGPAFTPARIVQAPLVAVTGQARVAVANTASTTLRFNRQAIDARTAKTVSTRNFTQSLTQSLLGDLHLNVQVLGLGLGIPSNLTSTVASSLGAATSPIDAVLNNLLTLLGVRVGEADVRVHGATCGRSVLVQ